tara:strand:- start:142 stop:411 length:270 start_codon:yes stop_codon:yes gene_type:complete
MKKLFLLSVLFIFMGNLSADRSEIIYEIEWYEKNSTGIKEIKALCIAGYVFVNYDGGTLTQLMEKVVMNSGTRYSVPMTCNKYREKMKQ